MYGSHTDRLKYGGNTGPVGGVTPPIPTATAASGSLYGGSSLLGGNARLPDVDSDTAQLPEKPQLVNGQDADADLGLYLDLNSVDEPQPIRGDYGQVDPGPRTFQYEKLNPDLFAPPVRERDRRVIKALDEINRTLGRGTIRYGWPGAGQGWRMQQRRLSPSYTTRWTDLPVARG